MANTVSFTCKVKEEITSNNYDSKDRIRALLSAYIRINGSMLFRDKKTNISLNTENAKIAQFIYKLLNDNYSCDAHLSFIKNFKNKTCYYVIVENKVDEILSDLDIDFLENKISKEIVFNDDSISGYLAGAFLASGSVNSPETSNYHLELSLNNENYAKWLSHLFARYKNSNIEPKIVKRREKYVLYFKRSDHIADFLVMIGAVNSCMEFENVRVDRDFVNSTNRLTNMDTANMKKTVATSKAQIDEIKFIDNKIGIHNLSNKKLMTLCRLRLENESASLSELAIYLGEELGKPISKSNVNHLFRSLHDLYRKYSQ